MGTEREREREREISLVLVARRLSDKWPCLKASHTTDRRVEEGWAQRERERERDEREW